MYPKIRLFLLALMLKTLGLSGVEYELEYHLTADNGLPSNETYYSFTTDDGDIWICTEKGLARFDGLRTRVYTEDDGLASRVVFKGVKDHLDRVWLITANGLSVYQDDSIYTPAFNKKLINHERYSLIKDVIISEQGVLFASTIAPNTGFFKISRDTVGFEIIKESLIPGCEEAIATLHIDKENLLYGLLKKNKRRPCADTIVKDSMAGFELKVYASSIIEKGDNLYFAINNDGRAVFSVRNHLFTEVNNQLHYQDIGSNIYSLSRFNGEILFSTSERLVNDKKLALVARKLSSAITSLNHNNNRLVLTSLKTGVLIIYKSNNRVFDLNKFTNLAYVAEPPHFYNDTLSLFEGNMIKQFRLSEDVEVLRTDTIKSLDLLYIGGYNHVDWYKNQSVWLNYILLQRDAEDNYTFSRINKRGDKVKKNFRIDDTTFLAVCPDEIKVQSIRNVTRDIHQLEPNARVQRLSGNTFGIIQSNDIAVISVHPANHQLQIQSRHELDGVYYVKYCRDHLLVASYNDGLLLITPENDIIPINCNFLKNNTISSILTHDDAIYFGTNKGVFRSSIKDLFNNPASVWPKQIFYNSVNHLFWNKNLWVQSNNYFTEIIESSRDYAPSLSMLVHNSDFSYSEVISSKKIIINRSEKLFLWPRFNEIAAPGKQRYFYRIANRDTIWRELVDDYLDLSSFEPGKYVLQLRGMDSQGNWSSKANFAQVTVNSGRFAFIGTGLALLFVITAFVALYGRSFSVADKYGGLVTKRSYLQELIIKLKGLEMNPHFLFNSLNTLRDILKKKDVNAADLYITELSSQLREIMGSTKNLSVNLDSELKRLSDYMKLEKSRNPKLFDVNIVNKTHEPLTKFEVPPMVLQPLVENSIWHGFKDMEDNGVIMITLELKNDHLRILVMDNGSGFSKDQDHSNHESMGLDNIRLRLDMLKMLRKQPFEMNILKNREAGTTVELIIPQKI